MLDRLTQTHAVVCGRSPLALRVAESARAQGMCQTDAVSDQESIAAMIFQLITVHHAGIPRYSACTAATVKPALFSKTRDSSKSQRSCYERRCVVYLSWYAGCQERWTCPVLTCLHSRHNWSHFAHSLTRRLRASSRTANPKGRWWISRGGSGR